MDGEPAELEARDPRLREALGESPRIERIAGGFAFTEGPLWHPVEGFLLFTDIPGDRIHRWSPRDGVSLFREPSNMANGLTYDRGGRLLACEHRTSRVTRTAPDGHVTVLASHYRGKALNSPNDIVVSRNGRVYFTDPHYGRVSFWGVPRPEELGFRGVFAIDARQDDIMLLADDFAAPNGLCLSLDETTLFVNDSERGHIRAFRILPDGTLAGGAVWARTVGDGPGSPDGMKLDSRGNLYCCGPGGVHVFAPDGCCLGVLRTPEAPANLAFGGGNLRDLFVTTETSLYRITVATPGLPVF